MVIQKACIPFCAHYKDSLVTAQPRLGLCCQSAGSALRKGHCSPGVGSWHLRASWHPVSSPAPAPSGGTSKKVCACSATSACALLDIPEAEHHPLQDARMRLGFFVEEENGRLLIDHGPRIRGFKRGQKGKLAITSAVRKIDPT